MHRDENLLFGVFAVQLHKITSGQLAEAAAVWATDPSRDLSERLVEMGVLSEDDEELIARLVREAIAAHEGDASQTLNSFGGNQQVYDSFQGSVVRTSSGWKLSDATVPMVAAALDATDTVSVREVPGRYKEKSEHSSGGMGRILLVHDETLGRDVALKELLPSLGEGHEGTSVRKSIAVVGRFLREAQLTGQLEHPGIVPVYELGRRADGTFYYTMKLVRGKTLGDALAEKKTLGERLQLLPHVVSLCQAVAYAHSRGVVHRDLKPANVMIGEFGETVVIDWGCAKVIGKEDAHREELEGMARLLQDGRGASAEKTAPGETPGTLLYMSPEQVAGQLDTVDERSDVYALGLILYEVLTGKKAFAAEGWPEVLKKVSQGDHKPVRELEPDVAPELVAICAHALEREPGKRYRSAKELADGLQAFISGRVFTERKARLSFVTAFYGFGLALLAAGAGILVYCAWEGIPRPIRVALLLTVVAMLYVFSAALAKKHGRHSQRAEVMMVLGTLVLGASMFLTGRLYASDGLVRHGFGWWALGAMVVAYAGRSNPNGTIAFFAAYVWFLQRTQEVAPAAIWWFPPLAAAATLPFAYVRESRSLFVGALLLIAASSVHVAFDNGGVQRLCLVVAACAALFFPWGLLSYASNRWRKFAGPAIALAVVALAVVLLPLGSLQALRFLAMEFTPGRHLRVLQLLPVGLACAMATVMWCLAAVRGLVWPELRVLSIAFLAASAILLLVVALGGTAAHAWEGESTRFEWAAFVMATSAAIILGTGVAWAGVALLDQTVFYLGTFLNALVTIHCAIEITAPLQIKAIAMIVAGAIVTFTGIRFESYLKKRLV